jgi:hypothetical protein
VQLAGWRACADLTCATCHGENRVGKRSGPPITGLAKRRNNDQLVNCFSDPDAMLEQNPHLACRAEEDDIGMPKISGKSPGYADKASAERLRALIAYVSFEVP